jgi:hypothetical protein
MISRSRLERGGSPPAAITVVTCAASRVTSLTTVPFDHELGDAAGLGGSLQMAVICRADVELP